MLVHKEKSVPLLCFLFVQWMRLKPIYWHSLGTTAPQAFTLTYLSSIMQNDSFMPLLRCLEVPIAHLLLGGGEFWACEIEWLRVREWAPDKASVSCLSALPQALPPLGWFICNSGLLLYWSVLMSQWSHTLDSALSLSLVRSLAHSLGEKATPAVAYMFQTDLQLLIN